MRTILALLALVALTWAAAPEIHWFRSVSSVALASEGRAVVITCASPPPSLTLAALVNATVATYGAQFALVQAALCQSRTYVVVETPGSGQLGLVNAQALSSDMVCWASAVKPMHITSAGEQTTGVDSRSLDRIDQRARPPNGRYGYIGSGQGGVSISIIDTGIYTQHQEFGGRAVWSVNTIGGPDNDCHGHGTHVASLAGGTTYGTAKQVPLYAVKVLDCNGEGTDVSVAIGVQSVETRCVCYGSPDERFVLSMSLQGPQSSVLDDAIASIYTACPETALVVAAAGNSGSTDCNNSPGGTDGVFTVAAMDALTDMLASFSNRGSCVEIAAPGVSVLGASIDGPTASIRLSGTSMSTPLTSGVAACFYEQLGSVNGTRPNVLGALVGRATKNALSNSPLPLLFSLATLDASARRAMMGSIVTLVLWAINAL
jgi:subtilisin family serine protease